MARLPSLGSILVILLCCFLSCVEKNQVDTNQGQNFFYYSQSIRLDSLDSIERAIRHKYALIDIKEERLSLNIEEIFAGARKEEQAYPNTAKPFYQAASNLWFFDRLRLLVAQFSDSHLRIEPLMEMPQISLGFKMVSLADGNYMVSDIDPSLEHSLEELDLDFSVGSYVYQLNGQPIHELQEEMARYISSSSTEYRLSKALEALSIRSFLYPKKPYATLSFKTKSGEIQRLKLPWTYDYLQQRPDALLYLKKLKFKQMGLSSPNLISGLHLDAPAGLQGQKEWYGYEDPSQLMQRSGYLNLSGKKVAYLQILAFSETYVLNGSQDSNSPVVWDQPLLEFLKETKRQGLPLILDMRQNIGGIVEQPIRLMSLLARTGESYASYVEGFRMTPSIQQIWQRVSPEDELYYEDVDIAGRIQSALYKKQDYSGIWSKSEEIKAAEELGGYDGDIVTLISSSCISACDILAILMESSERSTLIGSASNGTGAGYFNWEPYEGSSFVDMYEIFRLRIPNMLFGHGIKSGPAYQADPESTIQFNRENRPVIPQVPYLGQRQDFLHGDQGWLDLAKRYL